VPKRQYNKHINNETGAKMTVQELMNQLGFMDPNAEVHFQYSYGDHWHTQVAPSVNHVEEGIVKYSSYHQMDKVVEVDYDDEDAGEVEGKPVVLLG
jgi:hypothetical protein